MLQKGGASSRSVGDHSALLAALKAPDSSRVPCHSDPQRGPDHVNALPNYGKHCILFKLKMYITIHIVSLQTFLRVSVFLAECPLVGTGGCVSPH